MKLTYRLMGMTMAVPAADGARMQAVFHPVADASTAAPIVSLDVLSIVLPIGQAQQLTLGQRYAIELTPLEDQPTNA